MPEHANHKPHGYDVVERRGPHFARAALVGIISGLLAVAFRDALKLAEAGRTDLMDRLSHFPAWGWAVLPAIGLVIGCFVGWAVLRFAPETPGSGIPHVKGVLIRVREMRWKTLLPVKFLGGVLGIGAGLSLGREGPTVQMGAAIGNAVADLLKVPQRSVPQLISCGAGAGLAAAFNAPLAGFIFVIEELHRELSALTFGGALVAAVTATAVTQAFTGDAPSFAIRGFPSLPLTALPLVALLGAITGVVGVAFNKSVLRTLRAAHQQKLVRPWVLTGLCCAAVGLAAWWFPNAVGSGHHAAERLLGGHFHPGIAPLLLLLLLKFAFTVGSHASGAPGGIFAPMLLQGAILGLVFGDVAGRVFPSLAANTDAFAVLGMAAFFAASIRAPLTGIVLILEMTANYDQLFALCVVCLCSYLVAEALKDRPIYDALLEYDLRRRGMGASHTEPTTVVMGIQRGSRAEGKLIRQAGFPGGCLVVHIERAGRELLPRADLQIIAGDHITVLVPGDQPEAALEIVEICRGQ